MRKARSSTPMYLTELWRIGKNWQEKWDSKLGPRLEFYPKSIYFSFHFFLLGCSEKKMPVMILSIVIGTLSMYTEQLCWRVGLGLVIVPQNVNSLSIWINILRGSDENTDFTLKSLYFLWLRNKFLITTYKVIEIKMLYWPSFLRDNDQLIVPCSEWKRICTVQRLSKRAK